MSSYLEEACYQGVEGEKCIVGQYRTTIEQADEFRELLRAYPNERIPIEWIVDIIDQSGRWFYATAYHFDAEKKLVHVMLPDKHNPTFDGDVQFDHRTLRLVECVDTRSSALYNKIIRESIIKVKWHVKWFEEDPDSPDNGSWTESYARYYIQMSNSVLVEEVMVTEDGSRAKSYVMLTADANILMLGCEKGKGQEDFDRLVFEGSVQSSDSVKEEVNSRMRKGKSPVAKRSSGSRGDNGIYAIRQYLTELHGDVDNLIREREEDMTMLRTNAKLFHKFLSSQTGEGGFDLWENMSPHWEQVDRRQRGEEFESEQEFNNVVATKALNYTTKIDNTLKAIISDPELKESLDKIDAMRQEHKELKNKIDEQNQIIANLQRSR